eukprot:gene15722-46828_t
MAVPQFKTIALVITNRCAFLTAAGDAPVDAVLLYSSVEVSRISAHAAACNGVLDLWQADHFCTSFGASRPCLSHRPSAARH